MGEQTSLLLRRGTTAEIEAMVGQPSEPIHNVTNDDLILGANKAIVGGKQYVAKAKTASSMGYGVTSGNAIQVTIDGDYAYEEKNKFEFVQDVTALGPVTISVNNGENLPCVDTSGGSIDFEEGKIYVGWKDTDGVSVFQLAVRGSDGGDTPVVIGGTKFSHPYNGIDTDIQDEDGNTVVISVGEKLYFDGDDDCKVVGTGGIPLVDRTTPVEVVAEPLSMIGSGGRKMVVLDNGWIVEALNDGSYIKFRVSKDDGLSHSALCFLGHPTLSIADFSIASYGNRVTVVRTYDGGNCFAHTFDASTVANVDVSASAIGYQIDSLQSDIKGSSIAVDNVGKLHCTWVSKSISLPNSFNLKYSFSIDGGLNWSTPQQITAFNTTDTDILAPCIVWSISDGVMIVYNYKINATNSAISRAVFDGTSWTTDGVYNGGAYGQSEPSVVVLQNGNVAVAWQSISDVSGGRPTLAFVESSDFGAVWTSKATLDGDASVGVDRPSITGNASSKIFIAYQKAILGIQQILLIEGLSGSFETPEQISTSATGSQAFPSTCSNFNEFTKPLVMWKDGEDDDVKLYGLWGGGAPEQIFKKASEAVTIDDVTCTIGGTLLFSSPVFGDRVTGFKSDKDLITI